MKIALLLKSKKHPKSETNMDRAVVFDVEKNKVVGVENDTLELKDVKSLTSWAQTKRVKEIFTPHVDEQHRLSFSKLGISIKGYDELEDNSLFRTFIFG
jgi:NADH/NAD ratio-sensing transcriptional regulator Rex